MLLLDSPGFLRSVLLDRILQFPRISHAMQLAKSRIDRFDSMRVHPRRSVVKLAIIVASLELQVLATHTPILHGPSQHFQLQIQLDVASCVQSRAFNPIADLLHGDQTVHICRLVALIGIVRQISHCFRVQFHFILVDLFHFTLILSFSFFSFFIVIRIIHSIRLQSRFQRQGIVKLCVFQLPWRHVCVEKQGRVVRVSIHAIVRKEKTILVHLLLVLGREMLLHRHLVPIRILPDHSVNSGQFVLHTFTKHGSRGISVQFILR